MILETPVIRLLLHCILFRTCYCRPTMDERIERVFDITQGDRVNIDLAERVGVDHLAVSYPQVSLRAAQKVVLQPLVLCRIIVLYDNVSKFSLIAKTLSDYFYLILKFVPCASLFCSHWKRVRYLVLDWPWNSFNWCFLKKIDVRLLWKNQIYFLGKLKKKL